jgi:hypothetical protein
MNIEYNSKIVPSNGNIGNGILITPPINKDFWMMRVPLNERQAIVCFPKFSTICIGFQHEEDWNTNLPYTCAAQQIFDHIAHNKGDDSIKDEDCVKAIEMIQASIRDLAA